MNYNLENKKVLITGSSGGIGKSLCEKYLNANCNLLFTATSKEKIINLKNLYGNDHCYYHLDFSQTSHLKENLNLLSSENKDIDILINNAGTTSDNLFLRMKEDQWKSVIDINLNSNFYILKSILPNMIKNRTGVIIGITSVVALSGNPGQSNYAASKSAMISMYKSIALEVAQRNIRINLIAPGFIQTPMTEKLNNDQIKGMMDKIPMKKLGEPDDVSNLALFLSSNQSSYITGQTFHINGGMLMV